MIGPSALLSIPDNIRNIAIGLGLQGLFMPVLSVVGGTELSQVAKNQYKDHP